MVQPTSPSATARLALALAFAAALAASACDSVAERPGVTTDATVTQDLGPAPASCAVDGDCDDGKPCTLDRCAPADDGVLHCAWSIVADTCFAHDVCAAAGEARPGVPCEVCDPTVDARGWTRKADGETCEDGDLCTVEERCDAGQCVGHGLDCDDGNACTRERCERDRGCVSAALTGASCDDGVRCTVDDRCDAAGACKGQDESCDDGDPCTLDTCSEVEGCGHAAGEGLACEDGDRCSVQESCQAGACGAGVARNCDDGNSCTIDTCDAEVGCVHLPTLSPCCIGVSSVCDDQNPCTDDACDALTGACSYVANAAACDDGDPCTVDDVCSRQTCGGGAPRPCSDGNPCTEDRCEASYPGFCLHTAADGGACDDGIACTTAEQCAAGKCVGDSSACVCTPDLSPDGVKLTAVSVGASGDPGDGLDVDLNPGTCAPSGSCSGGVDNTLSVIAGFANGPLGDSVGNGQVMLVLEIGPLSADPVEVAVYQAKLVTAGCDFQHATCDYAVDHAFLDPVTCEPVARLYAHVTGDKLVGGGPGTSLPFEIPFDADTSLDVVIANLRIEATITRAGDQVTGLSGILGGAVPKQTLLDGIQSLPEDAFQGVGKDAVVQLVDVLVDNDIDTDTDGVKDAASIGVKITGIDANLVGVQ